ncbi:MAG: RdgB/HAM1 family non-canonical purine NTP pyrophosphatase [Coriobacteriia bacterium]|nr:RdgB/HAM1 family non-canonical purine NTP pyrophosphatase [Coriobacteriia bacterium]
MTVRIVVATGNKHKIDEIDAALSVDGFEFVSIYEVAPDWPSPKEDAETFEGNSSLKAMSAYEATGMPALADDSGLVVDALGGAPGIYSARFSGEDATDARNNEKLLRLLKDVPLADRTARFVSSLVLVGLDQAVAEASPYSALEGTCEGIIASAQRGEHGFGYDPLFLPYRVPGKTMAELTMDEKNSISHRGDALAMLKSAILFSCRFRAV